MYKKGPAKLMEQSEWHEFYIKCNISNIQIRCALCIALINVTPNIHSGHIMKSNLLTESTRI